MNIYLINNPGGKLPGFFITKMSIAVLPTRMDSNTTGEASA